MSKANKGVNKARTFSYWYIALVYSARDTFHEIVMKLSLVWEVPGLLSGGHNLIQKKPRTKSGALPPSSDNKVMVIQFNSIQNSFI